MPRVPVFGTRVFGLLFLAVEIAMPAGSKRYYGKGVYTLFRLVATGTRRC